MSLMGHGDIFFKKSNTWCLPIIALKSEKWKLVTDLSLDGAEFFEIGVNSRVTLQKVFQSE